MAANLSRCALAYRRAPLVRARLLKLRGGGAPRSQPLPHGPSFGIGRRLTCTCTILRSGLGRWSTHARSREFEIVRHEPGPRTIEVAACNAPLALAGISDTYCQKGWTWKTRPLALRSNCMVLLSLVTCRRSNNRTSFIYIPFPASVDEADVLLSISVLAAHRAISIFALGPPIGLVICATHF